NVACLGLTQPVPQHQIQCTLPAGQGTNLSVLVEVQGRTSSALGFSYDAPQISMVSPLTGDTQGGTVLHILGSNFGLNGSVTVGSAPCVPDSYSHTEINCGTPKGMGVNLPIVVTVGTRSVQASSKFSYNAPTIQDFQPRSGSTAGGTTLHIMGTNFG